MIGVINRFSNVICEVGTCFAVAAFTEYVTVIPGNSHIRDLRHKVDIVLCHRHETEFQQSGLVGTITAHGD